MAAKKTYNGTLEKRVLKAITTNGVLGQKLLALVTPEHFKDPSAVEAYHRVKTVLEKRSVVLSWADLSEDTTLDDVTRRSLAGFEPEQEVFLDESRLQTMFENVERLRRHRALNKLYNDFGALLNDDNPDIDSIEEQIHERSAALRVARSGVKTLTLGVGDNAAETVLRILEGEEVHYLPTGLKTFDDTNVGIPIGSFMMVAATTGGGKSALIKTLARNFAMGGASTAIIPLEMDGPSVLQRNLAEASGITMTKFLDPKSRMTEADKDAVWGGYRMMTKRMREMGAKMSFLEFEDDVNIQTALLYCKPMGYRVVIIDYLGLLEGADSDDQARALSRIARYAKIWASKNNAIVIGAAQLSDEGVVRYSRAMKEHASTLWQWIYSPASAETKSIHISQPKSRQQEAFSFDLHFDPATMEIRDLTEEERKALHGDRQTVAATASTGKGGNEKRGGRGKQPEQSERYFADLNDV